jgi:predicted RND superfamily exporter protein
VIFGTSVIVAGFGVGLIWTSVNTDLTAWFPRGSEVRESYAAIKDGLSGISPVNVMIDSEGGGPVTEPEVVAAISELAGYLDNMPEVGKALSFTDPLLQLHEGFSGSTAPALPHDRELIEQYLVLLESLEPLGDLLLDDRMSANIALRVNDNGSADLLNVARRAEEWWEENGVPGYRAISTGIMFEFARAEHAIAFGQIQGLAIALGAIGILLLVIFRRPKVAGAALVPNIIPLVVVFGAMGWIGIPLDVGNIVLGGLALGIAVDDTIHVVSDYCDHRRAGCAETEAVDRALRRALPAMVYTTAAIAIGFGVLVVSGFTMTRNLGAVTAAMVGICLLADVFLLPALLVRRNPPSVKRNPS